ncbi:hypothetical protein FF38_05508 [Lucilia cuprina]|uniref:Uncharacterized protein n=1 Tax=Lucilia cuprina TaxID=7375 RepID=A0A0L0CCQ8_LUCCU|nr:hypothetical protein FF38_05508 [Lucilia cuprina]
MGLLDGYFLHDLSDLSEINIQKIDSYIRATNWFGLGTQNDQVFFRFRGKYMYVFEVIGVRVCVCARKLCAALKDDEVREIANHVSLSSFNGEQKTTTTTLASVALSAHVSLMKDPHLCVLESRDEEVLPLPHVYRDYKLLISLKSSTSPWNDLIWGLSKELHSYRKIMS